MMVTRRKPLWEPQARVRVNGQAAAVWEPDTVGQPGGGHAGLPQQALGGGVLAPCGAGPEQPAAAAAAAADGSAAQAGGGGCADAGGSRCMEAAAGARRGQGSDDGVSGSQGPAGCARGSVGRRHTRSLASGDTPLGSGRKPDATVKCCQICKATELEGDPTQLQSPTNPPVNRRLPIRWLYSRVDGQAQGNLCAFTAAPQPS